MPLILLLKGPRDLDEEVQQNELENEEYQGPVFEGRYTDYLAKALAKVKATKVATIPLQRLDMVKDKSGTPRGISDFRRCTTGCRKEIGYSVATIETWIRIYGERCPSKVHHSGLDLLMADGEVEAVRDKLLEGKDDRFDATPPQYASKIPHILTAIKDYQIAMFEVCTGKKLVLTSHGEKCASTSKST